MDRRVFLGTGIASMAANPLSRISSSGPLKGATEPLPRVQVHSGGHLLQTEDGRPFFWLGDTAWELIHRTTREECSYYLRTRALQGFTVIQTVALAEFNGLNEPSALGLKPLIDNDPRKPNPTYFDRLVEIVDEAASRHLYVGLLPTWGDKLTAPWGDGPRIFRNDNLPDARAYAHYLASRLKDRNNVIWILGGDRPPRLSAMNNEERERIAKSTGFSSDQDWTPIWSEIAAGLAEGLGHQSVIAYHPNGGARSSTTLHRESWLSINGMQSGHGGGHDVPVWEWVDGDYALTPAKPTLDLEPNYEDHPYNPWPRWDPATGYFRDYDVRKQVYRSVFAGACGVTYGHHAIWGFVGHRNDVINHADRDWIDALQRPAGRQMQYLRRLIESRPYFSRIPDQKLIASDPGSGGLHIRATRDAEGTYAFVYFPMNDMTARIDLSRLNSRKIRAWWFDPRTGVGTLIGMLDTAKQSEFRSPPYGPDWVLAIEAAEADYPPPGLDVWTGH
jgi:hypothetical protein